MENNSISELLTILLAIFIFILFVLCIIYVIIRMKEKNGKNKKEDNLINNKTTNNKKENEKKINTYTKKSIFDFMEFEDVKDNMIIQKNGKRYLIIVECQGVNYDLMSKMEKTAVEEGFQQFLNTLRYPIQIYIQTRTMNLEKTIQVYKDKVKIVEDRFLKMQRDYNAMRESDVYNEDDLKKQFFELTKNKNLLEYGRDIISNTERMSLNKNVLTKKYYVIIPYFVEEEEKYSIEEIRNMAFSELYTKAQSIISGLSACSVAGKILNSNEIVELLYMAYNREEADIFGLDRALRAEYDSLYSTSQDVYEKKIKVLDEEIRERAIEIANNKIEEIKSRANEKADNMEDSMDDLANKMAQIILGQNKTYVGKEVAEKAIEELKEENLQEKEGGNSNELIKKKTKPSRRNTKQ